MVKKSSEDNKSALISCKYTGVRKRKWGKYVCEIRLPNSRDRIWLGSYDTAEKAARAFDAAQFCLRGAKGKFNFPDNPPDFERGSSMTPAEIQSAAARFANSEFVASRAADGRDTSSSAEIRHSEMTELPLEEKDYNSEVGVFSEFGINVPFGTPDSQSTSGITWPSEMTELPVDRLMPLAEEDYCELGVFSEIEMKVAAGGTQDSQSTSGITQPSEMTKLPVDQFWPLCTEDYSYTPDLGVLSGFETCPAASRAVDTPESQSTSDITHSEMTDLPMDHLLPLPEEDYSYTQDLGVFSGFDDLCGDFLVPHFDYTPYDNEETLLFSDNSSNLWNF